MKATHPDPAAPAAGGTELGTVVLLARLLQRIELRPLAVGPGQYRQVVDRLGEAMMQAVDAGVDPRSLHRVLDAHPSASELYENLQYRHAGLCRAPIDLALGAEMMAREVIGRARSASGDARRAGA